MQATDIEEETPVKIGIIGAGNVGGNLGKGWAAKGHQVMFGLRDPKSPKKSVGVEVKTGSVKEAAAFGDVVVLATPWQATENAVKSAGSLAGKVVVDCTNPLKPDFSDLVVGFTDSGGEQVAKWAAGAKVVKAFNSTGAGNMLNPKFGNQSASMFICGDDADAKKTVGQLVTDLGFEVVDAGPLRSARLLEPLAMLWVKLAYGGLGTDTAFKLLRR
jgi:predicted dinucleotide-binding enzyme